MFRKSSSTLSRTLPKPATSIFRPIAHFPLPLTPLSITSLSFFPSTSASCKVFSRPTSSRSLKKENFFTVDSLGKTSLHRAASQPGFAFTLATLVNLLPYGADVINERDHLGNTPLHDAVSESAVKLLMNKGARNDLLNKEGKTPFESAFNKGNLEVCETILRCTHGYGAAEAMMREALRDADQSKAKTPSIGML